VDNCGTDGGYAGIRLQYLRNAEIAENTIRARVNYKDGIMLRDVLKGIRIHNNKITGGNPLYITIISQLTSFEDITITNNQFYGWAVYSTDMVKLESKNIVLYGNTYQDTPWCFLYQ